jgi:hypothetical protein
MMITDELVRFMDENRSDIKPISMIKSSKYCVHSSGMIISLNHRYPRIITPVVCGSDGLTVVLYAPDPRRFMVSKLVALAFGLISSPGSKLFFKDSNPENPDISNLSATQLDGAGDVPIYNPTKDREVDKDIDRFVTDLERGKATITLNDHFIEVISKSRHELLEKISRKQIQVTQDRKELIKQWFKENWLSPNDPLPKKITKRELDAHLNKLTPAEVREFVRDSIYVRCRITG